MQPSSHLDIYRIKIYFVGVFLKAPSNHSYLPLISQGVSCHLSGHTLLIEGAKLALIINFDELLTACGRERDIQLNKRKHVRCHKILTEYAETGAGIRLLNG